MNWRPNGTSRHCSHRQARRSLGAPQLHVPHLIDLGIANGLRGKVVRGEIDESHYWAVLDTWRRLGVLRYTVFGLLEGLLPYVWVRRSLT